jgi:glycogen(starch) synthase
MRILFSSHAFAPSVGGLESVSRMLAEEFVRQGHEVRLITQTTSDTPDDFPFRVWRRPSGKTLPVLVRWCEVFFHSNISLPRAWPLLLIRRPWVVAHHVWIPRRGVAARAKRIALRYATGVAVSAAVAQHLSTASTIIPNPYDDQQFREMTDVLRTRDIVYLGRLVSDKGVDLLIAAVAELAKGGLAPTVTVIGSGPEGPILQEQVKSRGLSNRIRFAGVRRGEELVRLLNAHRLMVIPSRWQEPFGIVALEGMACGCVPIGSAGGGLRDAIGECGETFANGDATQLADRIAGLLRDPRRQEALRQRAKEHLGRHTRARVAAEYLRVFRDVVGAEAARGPTARGALDA